MSKESNPEADVKGQIERLLLEIKELAERREKATDPQAGDIIAGQIQDLEDQVVFLQRQLPEGV